LTSKVRSSVPYDKLRRLQAPGLPELADARAAGEEFQGRVGDEMRWEPVDRPGEATMLALEERP